MLEKDEGLKISFKDVNKMIAIFVTVRRTMLILFEEKANIIGNFLL